MKLAISKMVSFSRAFKGLTANALMLGFVAFVLVTHLFIRIIEVSVNRKSSCHYDEPIDVIYTWVNGSDQRFLNSMNKYLKVKNEHIDSSKQRFEDKNELRFSLRSLEKFAPWVNHVYLVTNGQIPYWLNLDYEKITIVTHKEIFRDTHNLPTFSSPAIESNLYRIPGLSKKFIYFNDDIFIGQSLYPDDFYAPNKGYIIFLDYNLPGCTKSCPWLYVGDGQCDHSCNTVSCQFDGGDCEENDQKAAIRIHSQEEESYNEKVNRQFDFLKQKVQKVFGNHRNTKNKDVKTNTSGLGVKEIIISNDVMENTHKKTEKYIQNNYSNNSALNLNMHKTNLNVSISKLVDDHNRKIIVQDKKLSRKKRFVGKGDHARRISRSAKNIDGYLESLLYTQRLLNKKFGFKPRYVPAHAPILIDGDIMQELQSTFPTEFELTERNRFRQENDIQFSFSYYYFLMSSSNQKSIGDIFDHFDTDDSKTWSDREIRNLLTKLYELPLSYEIVDHFEGILLNCSDFQKYSEIPTPPYERYIDSRLSTITKDMVTKCPFLSEYLKNKFGQVPKYKYQILKEGDNHYTTFKMLHSNITNVVIKLDEIRSKMTKFVCLNDNLDESMASENELVRAILYDFYLSLFPHQSKFELPDYTRNRFLHVDELNEWKEHHDTLKIVLGLSVVTMVFLTFFNVLKKSCCRVFSELFC